MLDRHVDFGFVPQAPQSAPSENVDKLAEKLEDMKTENKEGMSRWPFHFVRWLTVSAEDNLQSNRYDVVVCHPTRRSIMRLRV